QEVSSKKDYSPFFILYHNEIVLKFFVDQEKLQSFNTYALKASFLDDQGKKKSIMYAFASLHDLQKALECMRIFQLTRFDAFF
ncbi:hypothetical protein, partial [Escherichia coli]|uniref:hypothetical protein n=1 Tax=Escherichia coli TaxID=562 RepID=UPI001AD8CEF4